MDVHDEIEQILNEEDPLAREIWACGWTAIEKTLDGFTLIDAKNKQTKHIDLGTWNDTIYGLQYRKGMLPDGRTHTWIKETDGSADKFRSMIEKDKEVA